MDQISFSVTELKVPSAGRRRLLHLAQIHAHAHAHEGRNVVHGQVGSGIAHQLGGRRYQRGEAFALQLAGNGQQYVALALGTHVIAVQFANTGVSHRLIAVQGHLARVGKGLFVVHVEFIRIVGQLFVDLLHFLRGNFDLHAAHFVDDVRQRFDAHQHVMLDIHAEIFVHRAHGQFRAALGIGGVDFLMADAVNIHPGIPHDGGHFRAAVLHVHGQNHHGIGKAVIGIKIPGIACQAAGYSTIRLPDPH